MPVEPQDERTVIIGEKDFKQDYPQPDYGNRDNGYGNGYGNGNDYSTENSYDIKYDYNQRY
jgi:hypothetical protein